MVCGYYLSRFDEEAYASLGYGTQQATHDALGMALRVAPTSIKNWRDEFDPVHDNPRRGWAGREMYPSRRRTIEALGDMSQSELLSLVRTFIAEPSGPVAREFVGVLGGADAEDADDANAYSLRGQTGVKAENAFVAHHAHNSMPIQGRLIDRRWDQCGYDFEIEGASRSVFVEVKGLCGDSGGVTFTDKEWDTAKRMGDVYYLALIRHAGTSPQVTLIRNPFEKLEAQMRIVTTIQTGWAVAERTLRIAEEPMG